MSDIAIKVNHLSKIYRLYDKNEDRMKEALHPLRKKYHKDFYALKDIDFEIRKGETIGIIGRNGSGKSTLLKVITGVLNPSSGDVHVNGKISALLELGSGFNPEFTGMENVFFNGSIMGYTKEQMNQKLDDILSFSDIGEFIHQPVKSYSSGMFVRLAFALAINVDPEILIVDEALAVGDMAFQTKCMRRIKQFAESNKTLLFVSHDPGAVKTLCERAVLLDKGTLIDEGTPDKVFDYYNAVLAIDDDTNTISKAKADQLRERTGTREIEIVRVEMKNSRGISADTFEAGETVAVEITCRANEEIHSPTIGILIKDRLGNDIFGTNSFNMNVQSGTFWSKKTYTIRYSFDLNLGPNIYNITVAIHEGCTHVEECYDWINGVIVFKVIPSHDFQFTGTSKLIPKCSVTEQ